MDLLKQLLAATEGQQGEIEIPVERYQKLERPAAEPAQLALYVYKSDDAEPEQIPLGDAKAWEEFAIYGADQGGEWARLAHYGHSDPFRKDSPAELAKQLAEVPEQYAAIAGIIREAAEGAEGLMVAEAE